MSDIFKIIILASIGGIIGYITNVIAIKLIFRPIEPIRIPIINKDIIGLIPKRKAEIAENIGQIIQEEFLSINEIISDVITQEDKDNVVNYIKIKINLMIDEKMGFVPFGLNNLVKEFVSETIEEEIKDSIDELAEEMIYKASNRINIQEIVQNRINELDLYELEEIVLRIVKQELKHIEMLGLLLGFLIGLIQGIIVILM